MAAAALAFPLWDRDPDGFVRYDRPIRPFPVESQVIRLADRLRRPVAENPPSVPPHIMAAITAAVEISRAQAKSEIDVAAAVKTGIAETFALFDVDLTKPESVANWRKDTQSLRAQREAKEKLWAHAQLVFVGLLVVGISMLVWSKLSPPSSPPASYPVINPSTGRP